MTNFEKTIKAYLDGVAKEDEAFRAKYEAKLKADAKSITNCCNYICGWVRDQKRQGYTDEEIYGQALHYYDEADVKVKGSQGACTVVVNHAVALTEAEKKQAKAKALEECQNEQKAKLENRRTKKTVKAAAQPAHMDDLFAGML